MPSDGTTAFISYSREDSEFVLRMARDLKAAGANVWLDQLDIQPGQRWARALQDAITNAPRFLVILSPASVNSTNVEDEVSFALEEHKTIIPVLYCDCKVPFQLRPYQYADFRTDYDRGLKILLHTMGVEAPAGGVAAVVDAPKKVQPKVSDADEQARGAEQTRMEESRVLTAISTRLEEQKQAAEQAQLEETRLAAERARLQDEQRLATEKARREEEAKQAAEQARLVEARKAAELAAAEKKRKEAAEQLQREAAARKAAEQAAAEKKRKEATEKARLDEEARLAAERAAAEKKRKEAAERARGEEEAKRAQARVEQESKAAATVKADQEKGPVLLRPVGKYAIGAAALVFAGIVYFWLFKDTKPAPAPVVSHARVLSNKPPANDGQINGMAANGTNVPTPGMANGIPNGNIHANPNGMANGAGTGGETGRAALLGEHRLSLQWISWEKFGTATVVDNDGVLVLKGSQHVGDEYLTVEGTVTSVEPKKFTMHGVIVTKIDSINKGQPCRRSGDMTFAIIGARKFWRMQQVDNPCEAVTDYVDIYLR